VHASDDFRDLVKDGFDLAIRLGPLTDSTLRCRRVVRFSRVVCAAPALLARTGTPRTPAALASMPCLIYGSGAGAVTWTLRRASGEAARVVVPGRVRSNNLELLTELAIRGHGVTRLPEWAVRDAIRDGRLVRVLRAWQHERDADRGALYAVHPDDPGKDRLRTAFLGALDAVASR
jgi:DNA-binding transcriptional LysR family regulator